MIAAKGRPHRADIAGIDISKKADIIIRHGTGGSLQGAGQRITAQDPAVDEGSGPALRPVPDGRQPRAQGVRRRDPGQVGTLPVHRLPVSGDPGTGGVGGGEAAGSMDLL